MLINIILHYLNKNSKEISKHLTSNFKIAIIIYVKFFEAYMEDAGPALRNNHPKCYSGRDHEWRDTSILSNIED